MTPYVGWFHQRHGDVCLAAGGSGECRLSGAVPFWHMRNGHFFVRACSVKSDARASGGYKMPAFYQPYLAGIRRRPYSTYISCRYLFNTILPSLSIPHCTVPANLGFTVLSILNPFSFFSFLMMISL